jgi:hypothetical protein
VRLVTVKSSSRNWMMPFASVTASAVTGYCKI